MIGESKHLRDPFQVHVLFKDHYKGTIDGLFDEAATRFPGLDWELEAIGRDRIDTRDVTFAVDAGAPEPLRGMTKITGTPGRLDCRWARALGTSRLSFPDASEAVAGHSDHLTITVAAPRRDTSLAARFDAARRATCLGAVLAGRPEAAAVHFPSAELIVRPERWNDAAETAMRGEVPVLQWIGIYANTFRWDGPGPVPVTVGTFGMAAFLGHEIVMPKVRLDTDDAAEWVAVTVRMLMESDHVFRDGDTLGVEGGGRPIRIRHLAAGQLGMHTDTWALFHEASLLDDRAHCGIPQRKKVADAPENIVTGDWNALKNKLYCFVAGGR